MKFDAEWVTCPKHRVTYHVRFTCALCRAEDSDPNRTTTEEGR